MYKKRTNNTFTDFIRKQAVLQVIRDNKSLREVARQLGTDHSIIRRWVSGYKKFGEGGFHLGKRDYSVEFKVNVVNTLKDNQLSLHQASLDFGINSSVLQSWKNKFETGGLNALETAKKGRPPKMKPRKAHPKKEKAGKEAEADLLREVHLLRVENAYLKKLHALIQERNTRENGNGQKPSRD